MDLTRPPSENGPRSKQPRLALWVARGFAFAWLLTWTAITVFLDLVIATGMVTDFSGEPVFLVIFSIPFNAVLIMFWGLIVANAFLPKNRRPWQAAYVVEDGDEVRFRLSRFSAIWAAFLAAFAIPILTVIPFGMLTLGRPPWLVATIVLALVLASIVATYVIVARRVNSGESDIVIHRSRGTFALPLTFGRGERLTILCADLAEIRVVTEEKKDSEGQVMWVYAVTAQWHDSAGQLQEARLAELSDGEFAKDLAQSLRHEVFGMRETEESIAVSDSRFVQGRDPFRRQNSRG